MSKPAKLPVWKTTWDCYRLVFTHLGDFIRISWLWILVMIPVYGAMHALSWSIEFSNYRLSDGPLRSILSDLIRYVPDSIFLSAIAVSWHKLLLRNDQVETNIPWKLDRATVEYALWGLGIFCLPATLSAPFLPSEPSGLLVAIVLLAAIMAIVLTLRLCLKFPAIAVAEPISLQTSWRLTSGSTLRLFVISFLCWLPSLLALIATGLPFILAGTSQDLAEFNEVGMLWGVATSLAYAIPTIFGVTLLSLAYRHFVLTPHPLDSHGNLP